MKLKFLVWGLIVFVSTIVIPASAEQVLVAVAANFIPPFREVAMEFEKATGHRVQVAAGFLRKFLFANQERRAVRRVLLRRS